MTLQPQILHEVQRMHGEIRMMMWALLAVSLAGATLGAMIADTVCVGGGDGG